MCRGDDDLARVNFRIPGYEHLISGRVQDLSAGGLAAIVHKPPTDRYLRAGVRLPRLQIIIAGHQFTPGATVTDRKNDVVALRFEAMSQRDRGGLARFIFEKLSMV